MEGCVQRFLRNSRKRYDRKEGRDRNQTRFYTRARSASGLRGKEAPKSSNQARYLFCSPYRGFVQFSQTSTSFWHLLEIITSCSDVFEIAEVRQSSHS